MSKTTFSFNAKARDTAKTGLRHLMLASSPSSLLFNIFLKTVEDRAMVAIGSFGMTAIFYALIVLIDCIKDVPVQKPKKLTSVTSAEDTS